MLDLQKAQTWMGGSCWVLNDFTHPIRDIKKQIYWSTVQRKGLGYTCESPRGTDCLRSHGH